MGQPGNGIRQVGSPKRYASDGDEISMFRCTTRRIVHVIMQLRHSAPKLFRAHYSTFPTRRARKGVRKHNIFSQSTLPRLRVPNSGVPVLRSRLPTRRPVLGSRSRTLVGRSTPAVGMSRGNRQSVSSCFNGATCNGALRSDRYDCCVTSPASSRSLRAPRHFSFRILGAT
jgi:hypothetical protein